MTNPEVPQDSQDGSPAPEPTPAENTAPPQPAQAAVEHAAPAAEGASEGEGEGEGDAGEGDAGEGDAGEGDAGEGEAGGEGQAADGAAAAPGPTGEKKRRRRRRKKKHGAQAGEAQGAATTEPGGEAAPTVEGAEGASVEAKPADHPPRKKDKEKRHGPPRERPPVNGGDIVFGKIIEITDEAILIDIPGKAHAIFDRREMLLPDDDEPRPPPPRAEPAPEEPKTEAAADAPAADALVSEATVADAPATDAAVAEAPVAEAPVVEAPVVESPPVDAEAPTQAAPEVAVEEAVPPVPANPKVPRVILEVGADFIGMVHSDGGRGGLVVLTHHPRRAERSKFGIEKAFNDKTTIEGLVTGVIKGGIEVDVDGVRAFAPGSHVELRLGADLSHLVAKRLPFFVTQYAKRGRDVVLSRRAMLEEEAKKTRAEALSRLKVGEDIDGIVRSIVPFGAFVDIGGIEGLVPLQEMSHNRADGPSDVFKAGEPTRVKVTKIDDKGKIWLSHKATIDDPWQAVAQKYAQGSRHTGKVVRLQPFGVFVELEPGIDGLIHLADLSLKRIEGPEEVVKVGESIEVVVSHVEPGTHRIALHPAPQGDAANEAPQRIAPHKPVKAKVVMIETGGLVVRILGVTGRNGRGYVTAAGTGTPRGTELRKVFNIGQEIEGKVIEMDPRRGEVKLSIKALSEDNERSAYQQYRTQLKAEAKFTLGDLLKKNSPR
jgi:small subunit ribosomal protein S1